MGEFSKKFDWLNSYLCVPGKTKCSGLEDILTTVVVYITLDCRDAQNNLLQYMYHRVYSGM